MRAWASPLALHDSPRCPRGLLLYFLRLLLRRQFSAVPPLAALYQQPPASSELSVPVMCFIIFFQSTYHHPKFYFLCILCSYLLITHHPREFCESGTRTSGSPPQPPCSEQGCCRNGWARSVRTYRRISGHRQMSSFPMDLTDSWGTHLVVRAVNWEFFVFVFTVYHENTLT